MDAEDKTPIEQLLLVMRCLRDPKSGCAWDVKQNFQTIAPYTLEEAYEVVDAIDRGDLEDLKDELGDLLLQVVFHAQIASEQSVFDFDDVANAIVDKMIRRHPHVFADEVYETDAELKAAWESTKQAERRVKQDRNAAAGIDIQTDVASALDGVAANLPSLKRADKIQKRAARVGFDWPDIEPVWAIILEEIAEVREALEADDAAAVEDEIGDLLFSVVNLARHADVDAETALRKATLKFSRRFRRVEQLAETNGQSLSCLQIDELDSLWDLAKQSS